MWRDLAKVGLYPCPSDEFFEINKHDAQLDPDIVMSYFFNCLRLEDGSEVRSVSISICATGDYDLNIYDIPVQPRFDTAAQIGRIEGRVQGAIRLFLQSQGLI